MPEDHRLAAIMFTDIVGYTKLMGTDEDQAFKILTINREIHNTIISRHNGTLIKEMGDGILASFHTSSDAVRCAIEIQQEAKSENIKLRIGIHEGEMVFAGDDVLGDGVNVASRLEETAKEESINISGAVYRDIKNKAGITTRFVGDKTLKNVDDPVKVYEVICKEAEQKPAGAQGAKKDHVKLIYFIIGGLMVVTAAVLIWFNLQKETAVESEKSIAVLPFETITKDSLSQYIADGVREAILNNLQKIKNLHVGSRTSSATYRNSPKRIPEIASELGVATIMEGSAQKFGDQIRITIQVIDGKTDNHIWSEDYDRQWGDIFAIYTEIAEKVADALQVVITPEERQQIVAVPTANVTAYDYILQGRQEIWKYWLKTDTIALKKAENLFNEALKLDPEYALGWTMKASIYWSKYGNSEDYFKHDYLDSVLWYCNKAISIDPDVSNAYLTIGILNHNRGNIKKAITNYEKTIETATKQKDDLSTREALWRLGYIYLYKKDYIKGIALIQDALELAQGSPNDYSHLLHRLGFAYTLIGAYEVAEDYYIKSNNLRGMDTQICDFYNFRGDFQTSIDNAIAYYKANSSDPDVIQLLANTYLQLRDFEKSLDYFREFRKHLERLDWMQWYNIYREGFVLVQLGHKEEGMELIERQLAFLDKQRTLQRASQHDYHYAAIYAFQGDYESALKHLRNYNKKELFMEIDVPFIPISYAQYDILFENLWDNEEFKVFIKEIDEEKTTIRAQVQEMMDKGDIGL